MRYSDSRLHTRSTCICGHLVCRDEGPLRFPRPACRRQVATVGSKATYWGDARLRIALLRQAQREEAEAFEP